MTGMNVNMGETLEERIAHISPQRRGERNQAFFGFLDASASLR